MSWMEVDLGGRKARVAVVRSGGAVWVSWAGVPRRLGPDAAASEAARPVEREIRAPMTGKVAKVTAVAGGPVSAGQPLVVLEAMKMEYRLAAPRDGIVESVGCKEGDRVDLGQLLVTLAP